MTGRDKLRIAAEYSQSASVILAILFLVTGCSDKQSRAGKDWPVYMGSNSSSHYSDLDQINKRNIGKLDLAWEYHTGDNVSDNRSQIQCNPIIIDGILYATSPRLKVFALDAASGKRLWEFDPNPGSNAAQNVNRGVTWWQSDRDKRIFFSSGPDLYALNAENGQVITSFGDSGKVSLKEGLGERSKDLYVVATSPGIIYKDLIIIGSRVSEDAGAAPGYIRAFNARTGKMAWVFHTIPLPEEFGYDTWPKEAYKTAGGVNSWAGMSLDEDRGIVYIPTGSAAFDFWGGDRKGANLFANCILALDAATGERIWHYQTVHHDIWDRDLPAPPNLVTVKNDGRKTDAVAQITKSGFIFLLDRETGKSLFPVEEREVPGSDLENEEAWPTQPFPELPPPFSPQAFTSEQVTGIFPESKRYVTDILNNTRTGKQFIPPSTQGTVIFPGFDGGGEWGGAAVDPASSIIYVNGSIMPWILTMVETGNASGLGEKIYRTNCAVCHGIERKGTISFPSLISISEKYTVEQIQEILDKGKGFMPSFKQIPQREKDALIGFLSGRKEELDTRLQVNKIDTAWAFPYTHTGYNRFVDQNGYPAVKPPWGTISAIDLNKGTILWQVPLGEFKELTRKGIPQTGTENYGGPAVTKGGILFIGASKDEYFRAFDMETGKELWKYKLPAGGYATPAVYEAGGKEYVVIACGGGKMGTQSGDCYMAFSLKKR